MIEDMKSKIVNVNVAYYINLDTLRAIEQAVGVQILGKFDDFFIQSVMAESARAITGRRCSHKGLGAYLIIVADAADAVSVNFFGRCKFLGI